MGTNLGVIRVQNARAGKKSDIFRFWSAEKYIFESEIIFQVSGPGDSCDDSMVLTRTKTTLGRSITACTIRFPGVQSVLLAPAHRLRNHT